VGGLSLISGLSCGAGGRCSLDSALPWLWRRPAVTAPMEAWEPPFAMGAALKRKKIKIKINKNGLVINEHSLWVSNIMRAMLHECIYLHSQIPWLCWMDDISFTFLTPVFQCFLFFQLKLSLVIFFFF